MATTDAATTAPAPAAPASPHREPLRLRWATPLAALGGAILWLAFPPVNLWPLAPLGLAALVVAAAGQRARGAFAVGLAFSYVFFALLVRWLIGNIGPAAFIALSIAESVVLALLIIPLPALLKLTRRVWLWPPIIAVWWTATEAVRSRVPFGGFPWGRLAFSQAESPALGWARVAGAPAVTFVVALVAGGLAVLWLAPAARARLAAGLPWTVAACALAVAMPLPNAGFQKGDTSGTLSLVQGNVPKGRTLEETARVEHITRNHSDLTAKLAKDIKAGKTPEPDLVVWPENATDDDARYNLALRGLVQGAVDAVGKPILVGGILNQPDDSAKGYKSYNAGQLWWPSTSAHPGPGVWYAKRQLVPFGEYIPFRSVFGKFGQLQLIPRDFSPGDRTQIFKAGPIKAGDVICYEIGYDGRVNANVRAGANLLVEQTNDATFIRDGATDEPEQQLAMARLRAVEHDRSVAVVSTTGESAVIRPNGTLAAHTGIWQQALITKKVPLRTVTTPATRVGAWPELGIGVIAAGLTAAAAVAAVRRRRSPE
ncbi:apolipoprotein N-acyltransferase [Mangrovactinospora gilvigrisea]|uniref:Apolipoprotein N-acyltransferase n=1 Tax=Mangrovactinospora gilvigrisea TaxID=1428644 RepID=A0A1J7C9B3_9ACTN|nr:apolipoprotein N-acyltransferase [Mangrovactinospora gilvigrisea]OIV36226.1 apolipoprotein N-acyltransferase [Mangrovactinospora gilvigrisea]